MFSMKPNECLFVFILYITHIPLICYTCSLAILSSIKGGKVKKSKHKSKKSKKHKDKHRSKECSEKKGKEWGGGP